MRKWLFKKFDSWAIRTERKFAYVDVFGQVLGYRYYIFYVEDHFDTSWKAKHLPNLFVQNFTGLDFPNGVSQMENAEDPHFHPWSTLSIILKGGYSEEFNHGESRADHKAPAIEVRAWNTSHRVTKMTPNTWTLFFHWIRRGNWAFDIRPHKVVCDLCAKENNGVCVNEKFAGRRDFVQEWVLPKRSLDHKGWKNPTWLKCDDDFDGLISERQRVVQKLEVRPPQSPEEWKTMFGDRVFNLRVHGQL